MKPVIFDAREGIKAAVAKMLKATWQRCRVHFLRNCLAHAGKGQRQMVMALINTVFAQDTHEAVVTQWRIAADQLPEKFPKPAPLMDGAECEVLAFMTFPKSHRVQAIIRVLLQIQRSSDSGSPRVCLSIILSKNSSSSGSETEMDFRPALGRRIRPGISASPVRISRIPLRIALRDRPLARCHSDTPP